VSRSTVSGTAITNAPAITLCSWFNQFGDLERCSLRPGNVHSADGWEGVFKPVVERYHDKVSRIYFRADAAYAIPGVYKYLEAERIKYAIRLPAN
jgi:Transposase DDE domain group 1